MNMFTLFILLAVAATVISLVFGVSSMAVNSDVGHRNSAQWMTWRVLFQAVALGLMLLALQSPH